MVSRNEPKLQRYELDQFTGTSLYYQYVLGTCLTDGTRYLAEKARCFWLMDAIASFQMYQEVRELPIQFWRLKVNEDLSGLLELGKDLPEPIILRQKFSRVDFNADYDEQIIYCEFPVIYLPSEH